MNYLRILSLLLVTIVFTHCSKDDTPETREIDINEILTSEYTITMNPSGNNVLSAQISVQTQNEVTVEVEVLGEHPLSLPMVGPAKDLDINVFGLYAGVGNKVALRFTDMQDQWAVDTVEITTDELPDHLPEVEVLENKRVEKVMTLAGLSVGNEGAFDRYAIMVDMQGEIRWILDLTSLGGISFPVKILNNGNLIFGLEGNVYEYNWMGEEINAWHAPGFTQHHEIVETPNETFILAVDNLSISTEDDFIVEIDRESGEILREWDMRQILDVDRFDFIENQTDWFHMNAIWYIAEEDALIVSGNHQGLVKVSGNNDLIWIMAPHKGWGKAGLNGEGFETSDFLLEAINAEGVPYPESVQQGTEQPSDFSWMWSQHAPMLLNNGNLFVFDNGFNRNFTGDLQYSRGVEYAIDEENMTVKQIWQFGKERGENFYSRVISDVDVNQDGNRVITAGIINAGGPRSRIVEVDENKNVIYELQLNYKDALGGGCYRSEQVKF